MHCLLPTKGPPPPDCPLPLTYSLSSPMQLRFLGTGTSAGIPVIACDCSVCTSTDPRDTRTRCSATLEFTDPTGTDRVILIDTSPDLRTQVLRENITRIDAILFTHNHVDHTFGLDEVRRFNEVMKQTIPIYADEHTMNALGRVYQHIFSPHTNIQSSFIASLEPTIIFPYEPFTLFGLTITPVTLMHGKLPILGYLFEQPSPEANQPDLLPLAYCTDVSHIPDDSMPHLERANTLVLDALRERPHKTHFTVEQAVEAARQINASRTYLIHMTHDLAHQTTDTALPDDINLAYDGLIIPESGF
ncbi:MAG: MBL fold metallo-hydrolase [Phycisphaerae bacterium]|nr:MBL fold metallo-hydrolase [Phycisphaerae bacterium]MBM90036.1 MBL fold metallo-hydrolase [Phycisphaerae bacterium]HCT44198.1 MBL fold metallo-hydrolase [Phycisphaerales bacterium]